jgi:inosose dehydratase
LNDPVSALARPATSPSREVTPRRLPEASIGIVPIVWNNVDLMDLAPAVPPDLILATVARLGFQGVQFGRDFPVGERLAATLATRGLRLAEVYAEITCTDDGPIDGSLDHARARLDLLDAAGGEVLVAACHVGAGSDASAARGAWAGRGDQPGAPRFTETGWRRLAELLDTLAIETEARGHRLAFHPHGGTHVETPDEVDRLAALTDSRRVGLCLDIGHYTVGGGDPVDAIRTHGERVRHVHLKDVDAAVLARLRAGELKDFSAAIRERLFTELGRGIVDLAGVIDALEAERYGGWLMVEQDSTWLDPAAAAAIGKAAVDAELEKGMRR